ncbi:MAG: type VI secretion system protein TssA [Acidobacteria bacterium]|nr:MAG: type VI secretion system protein TssA [Acidobacteriota bacterium]
MDYKNYLEAILKPISSDKPCGEDPKYETLYEGIRAEVAKASGIGHGAPDWEKVEKDSMQLLTETAKEINLMAYLVTAMSINHNLDGMVLGFQYFRSFLDNFWPNMFPPLKKKKIRARAISWLNDRVTEQSSIFKVKDRPLLEEALEALNNLKGSVYDYFEDPPSKFSGIRNAIEDQLATLPKDEPKPSVEEKPVEKKKDAPKATTEPSSSQKPAAVQSVAAPTMKPVDFEDLSSLKGSLIPLAHELFKTDPLNPISYTLNREASWLGLKTPKSQSGGTTFVPAPVPELQTSLKTMQSKANWEELLTRCEALLPRWPLWLDLQFYAYTAANNLGPDYQQVPPVIAYFGKRISNAFPALLKLKFDDGSAFANALTKKWLNEIQSEGGGGAAPAPEEEFAAALAEKGVDQLDECLQLADKMIHEAPSRRIQFMYRTELARFYLEAGQKLWCLAILKAQKEEIDRCDLENWEPAICGPVWSLFLQVLPELQDDTPGLRSMVEEARMRLSRTRIDLSVDHQLGSR